MWKSRAYRTILYASLFFGWILVLLFLEHREARGPALGQEEAAQGRDGEAVHAATPGAAVLASPVAEPASPDSTARKAVAGSLEVRVHCDCELGTHPTLVLSDERGGEVRRALVVDLKTPTVWNDLAPGTYGIDLGRSGWKSLHRTMQVQERSEPTRVDLALQPESSVGGLVTDASTGRPLRRFEVLVQLRYHDPPTMASTLPMMPCTFEGDTGEYCYGGIPSAGPSAPIDSIQVQVRCPGYATFESEWIAFSGAGFFGRVDVALQPLEAAVARVSGTVLEGPEETPVAGARVGLVEAQEFVPGQLLSIGEETFGIPWASRRPGSEDSEAVLSSSDGSFEIEVQGEGSFRLVALKPGERMGASEPMDLAPGTRREGLRIVLDPGAGLRGRIVLPADTPESTATGVRILDLASERERWTEVIDGAFDLSGLEPGPHRVTLFVDPGGAHVGPFSKGARAVSSVDATLRVGETTRVVLDAAGSSQVEGLHGVVLPPQEAPDLHFVAAILKIDASSAPWALADVPSDGRFTFEASPDAPCAVFAGGSDDERNPSVVAMAFAELPARERRSASPLQLRVTGPSIEGHLPPGMQSSRGARVRLRVEACEPSWIASLVDGRELTPDASGTFRLIGLPPGDYALNVPGTSARAHVHLDPGFRGTLSADLR